MLSCQRAVLPTGSEGLGSLCRGWPAAIASSSTSELHLGLALLQTCLYLSWVNVGISVLPGVSLGQFLEQHSGLLFGMWWLEPNWNAGCPLSPQRFQGMFVLLEHSGTFCLPQWPVWSLSGVAQDKFTCALELDQWL